MKFLSTVQWDSLRKGMQVRSFASGVKGTIIELTELDPKRGGNDKWTPPFDPERDHRVTIKWEGRDDEISWPIARLDQVYLVGEPSGVVINGVVYIPAPEQPEPSTMTAEEVARLKVVIDHKGWDYAFHSYSAYDYGVNLVRDKRFHQLLVAYNEGRDALMNYLREQGIEE